MHKRRLISTLILIAYSVILIKVVVFKGLSHRAMPMLTPLQAQHVIIRWGTNFVPFKTLLPQSRGEPRWSTAIVNLIGNTVLFVPVGFLVPLVYRRMTWGKALALGVAVGVAMEGMEWIFNVGVADVDDVILNALGVMVGYAAFWWFARPRQTALQRAIEQQA